MAGRRTARPNMSRLSLRPFGDGRLRYQSSCFVREASAMLCHARRSPPPPCGPGVSFRRSLAFALTFDGRRQFKTSGEMMAQITAEHLARHLEMSGYVIMKRPPGPRHKTPG